MTESIQDVFAEIAENLRQNKTFALATVIRTEDSTPRGTGSRMIVYPDGSISGTVGGGPLEGMVIRDAMKNMDSTHGGCIHSYNLDMNEKPNLGMRCGGKTEVLIESYRSRERLVILGGGHVGERIAAIAREIHIPFTVVDDREEFSRKERFPGAEKVIHVELKNALNTVGVTDKTYIVIVSRCHAQDEICLKQALKTNAAYIGMIGSKNKIREVFDRLDNEGIAVKNDPRVYAPVGLALGDKSPEEIALSVISEIVTLKGHGKSIHRRLFPVEKDHG